MEKLTMKQAIAEKKINPKVPANMIQAAEALFKAMALCETLKEVCVDGIQQRILQQNVFMSIGRPATAVRDAVAPHRVTNPNWVYMLSEEDYTKYWTMVHNEYLKAGFDVQEFGRCPHNDADNLRVDAEKLFMESTREFQTIINPDDVIYHPEARRKFIDLHLSICAPYVKNNLKK